MNILSGKRGIGKTTELIKKSNKEWLYIVCANRQRVDNIAQMAMDMKLDIPYPVTFAELPFRSQYVKEVLIDDLEDVLATLVGKPIKYATTSCKIENLNDEVKIIK